MALVDKAEHIQPHVAMPSLTSAKAQQDRPPQPNRSVVLGTSHDEALFRSHRFGHLAVTATDP